MIDVIPIFGVGGVIFETPFLCYNLLCRGNAYVTRCGSWGMGRGRV